MLTPSNSYVFQRSYNFFDEMCEEVRQWNLDFQQIERGHFSGEILQFGTGPVHIAEARFRRLLHQRGVPPQGLRTIAVPASKNVRIKWRGQQCDGRTDLMVFPKQGELESVSDQNFHVFTCSFPEELLASLSDQLEVNELDQICGGHEVIRCEEQALTHLRDLLNNISTSLRDTPETIHSPRLTESLSQKLPGQILSTIATSQGVRVPILNPNRQQAVSKALNVLDLTAPDAITMSGLAAEVGVSQRTLEYSFREHFGITPKMYHLTQRLHRVRHELRQNANRKARISDLANRWGFWHMGQFAADYESVFGELPSETRTS